MRYNCKCGMSALESTVRRREGQVYLMVKLLVGRKDDFLWKRELASLVSVSGLDCEHDKRSKGSWQLGGTTPQL